MFRAQFKNIGFVHFDEALKNTLEVKLFYGLSVGCSVGRS